MKRHWSRWTVVIITFTLSIILIVGGQLRVLNFTSLQCSSMPFFENTVVETSWQPNDGKIAAATPRVWVQLVFSAEFDQDIMPHTLDHYINKLGADPEYMLIGLHHRLTTQSANQTVEKLQEQLRQDYGLKHFFPWNGLFSSLPMWNARMAHRQLFPIKDCDWIVRSDSDELPHIPGINNNNNNNNNNSTTTLSQFLEFVSSMGYDAVFGIFNDRVAARGNLPNLTTTTSLDEQFPLSCQITKKITHGLTSKVVAFRAYHCESRAGHSLLDTTHRIGKDDPGKAGYDHCGFPTLLRIDHFKWTFGALSKLKKRVADFQSINKGSWKEPMRFLDHVEQNGGKLAVNDKSLRCRDASFLESNQVNQQEIYAEGTRCGNLYQQCPV